MQAISTLMGFVFLAALVGIAKPYLGKLNRKHFALLAVGSLAVGVATMPPPTPEQIAERKARDEARARERSARDEARARERAERNEARAKERAAREEEERRAEEARNQERATREETQRIELARVRLGQLAKQAIIDSARNPDSVSFSFVGVSDDLSTVCLRYRAQNGFGGMNIEHMALVDGEPHQSAARWNRHCVGARLHEV